MPALLTAGWSGRASLRVSIPCVGQITIANAMGVPVRGENGPKTVAQYSVIELEMRRSERWVVTCEAAV